MEVLSDSEAETLSIAARFAATVKAGDAVALQGPLGAGKTLFARGVAQALGFAGAVASPTYALAHEYPARIPIVHMDLYRLAPGSDWEEIGLSHYFGAGAVCLVEWPERLPPGLQNFTHWIELEPAGEARRKIRIRPGNERS